VRIVLEAGKMTTSEGELASVTDIKRPPMSRPAIKWWMPRPGETDRPSLNSQRLRFTMGDIVEVCRSGLVVRATPFGVRRRYGMTNTCPGRIWLGSAIVALLRR
jgi:hypothetical protein